MPRKNANGTAPVTEATITVASQPAQNTAENNAERPKKKRQPRKRGTNEERTERQTAAANVAEETAAPARKKSQKRSVRADATTERGEKRGDGTAHTRQKNAKQAKNEKKVCVIPLGGLDEIGKNITVIEYDNDMLIVDCGIGFPDDDMFGVDLVIPDFTYLEANREKIRGVVLTHGHEDHVGAVPYLLRSFNVPVYGTALTLGIVKNKLVEHRLGYTPKLNTVKAGSKVKLGAFEVEFIHVNHSIADACALAISTPCGTILHTGDFKLDVTPIDGDMMDITRLGEIGRRGVKLLLCESTNAEHGGFTPSERSVGGTLEDIFTANADRRIIIATFSSNVHRVKQIVDISLRHGRKVAVTGRSMTNIVSAATDLGYMSFPVGSMVDVSDIKRYKPGEITLITTGSQGEPMSALYRMAFSEHSQVKLGARDLVVLSSSAIPGNEKLIGRIINELARSGIKVIYDGVHASGHACAEELKLMQQLTKPKFFMPVHGEARHLAANRELAMSTGIPENRIFVGSIGQVLEFGTRGAAWNGSVPAGRTLVDGYGIGDVGNSVLRDRKHLSEDGIVIVAASIDPTARLMLIPPEIISKGFVYAPESEELLAEARGIASREIASAVESRRNRYDPDALNERIRRELSRFFSQRTGRNPMIIPVITEL